MIYTTEDIRVKNAIFNNIEHDNKPVEYNLLEHVKYVSFLTNDGYNVDVLEMDNNTIKIKIHKITMKKYHMRSIYANLNIQIALSLAIDALNNEESEYILVDIEEDNVKYVNSMINTHKNISLFINKNMIGSNYYDIENIKNNSRHILVDLKYIDDIFNKSKNIDIIKHALYKAKGK